VAWQARKCTLALVRLTVLTWNLFHGRALPPAGRNLFEEFAAALAGWEWDAALLQEVPPWWPPSLASRTGADQRLVLTSRNSLLALRRAVAVRRPDLIKSNSGGCNAILVRECAIVEHRTHLLSRLPERRRVHGVRLDAGTWLANLHTGADVEQGRLAANAVLRWSAGAPSVLGGDFNVRDIELPGFTYAGGFGVDQVFARGLSPDGQAQVLDRGQLSDHAPVAVHLDYAS